jgi:cell division protein FtsL
MSNNWLKYLVALSAVMIAGSAAYFSVTGLGILFSGASVAVMIMASSLEFAKLVSATYLKQRWDEIKGFNKWYLSFSVGILMLITSAGIFGYLSNAFQQQNIKIDQVQREIQVWQNKIDYTNQQIVTLQTQQKDLSTTQNTLITKGNVNSRLLRSVDNRDRQTTALNKKINVLQDSIVAYNGYINNIKNENIEIEREVGGFRFVAEAFGVSLNTVVKFFIILIVIVFDPLAIALVIAFNQLIMTRKKEDRIEVDVKHDVEEAARLKLSEEDLKKLEEVLMSPPAPNEKLKEASKRYSEEVKQRYKDVKVDFSDEYKRRGELLAEMMKNDQELGLYDEPFDNPMIKDTVPALSDEEVNEMVLNEWERKNDDNISDWDSTLMDGLEDEEPFFTEEELQNILQEEPTIEEEEQNFSTIEPNMENIFQDDDYLTEAIREFNQQSMEDEWNEELEEQFWREQPPLPFATDVELESLQIPDKKESTEPYVQLPEELDVNVQILNETLSQVNNEIDGESSSDEEKKN